MVEIVSNSTDIAITDVVEARHRIEGIARETPAIESLALGRDLGAPVHLKLETLQATGAFKVRGAANAILSLPEDVRARGVVTVSTGNHGRAVAYVANRLGVPAVVCLSRLVPANKVDAVRALGAEVRIVGTSQDEAQVEANRIRDEEGLTEIPPFDNAAVIAGQGTIGLELVEQVPAFNTALVPLSGGGLIAGTALALKARRPGVRVIGVTMKNGAAMQASLAANEPVEVAEVPSLADSLGGGIGLDNAYTFRLVRELVDEVVLVSEAAIARAMRYLFREERLVTEGAAAVGVAALLEGLVAAGPGPTVAVLSGHNIDPDLFLRVAGGEDVDLAAEARA